MRRPLIDIPMPAPANAKVGSGDSGGAFDSDRRRHARDAHLGDGFDTWLHVLGMLRFRQPNKTAEHIAAWTGHSLRTVYRWMAGETVPGIDVGFDLITRTGHGPAIIELIARSLPARERAQFFLDLIKVATRAYHQAEIDAQDE